MSSQYEHSLLPRKYAAPESFLALRRRDRKAELKALKEHNLTLSPDRRGPLPPAEAGYDDFATTHLALLVRDGQNQDALAVLARRLGRMRVPATTESLETPEKLTAFYRDLPTRLLSTLWDEVRDDTAFRALLHRGDRGAIEQFVERCNALPHPNFPIPMPRGKEYREFHLALLAMLFSVGGNEEALDALIVRVTKKSLPHDFEKLPKKVLERLWVLAGDAAALAELWRREDRIDVHAPLTDDTLDKVLGYRWCFFRCKLSWQKLFDRYCRLRIPYQEHDRYHHHQDHLEERALLVLQQIPRWDFRTYPDLRSWICTVEGNARIDLARQAQHKPRSAAGGLDEPIHDPHDPHGERSLTVVEHQDELDTKASWLQVLVLKIKAGHRLKRRELTRLALHNLEARGNPTPTPDEVDAERAELSRKLAERRRNPKTMPLKQVIAGYKPVRASQLKRISRLRVLHDRCRAAIDELGPAGSDLGSILSDFDILFGRAKGETWSGDVPPAAFVARLLRKARDGLNEAANRGADLTALDRCQAAIEMYVRQFPLLLKAARVRDLVEPVGSSHPQLDKVEKKILEWIDGGKNWLATLRKQDRKKCAAREKELTRAARRNGGADLELQILWLRSVLVPGRPRSWLSDLDTAWQIVSDLGTDCPKEVRDPAEEMVHQPFIGNSQRLTAVAGRLRSALASVTAPAGWRWHRLRLVVSRLCARKTREESLLRFCRTLASRPGVVLPAGLLEWLEQDGNLGATAGPEVEHGRLLRERLRRQIDTTAATDLPALRLLDLALGALLGSGLPGLTAEALCAAWHLCHDPTHGWADRLAEKANGLVTAAHGANGEWGVVTRAAGRIRSELPHCHTTPRGIREELLRVLSRLARGPRSRGPGEA